MSESLKTPYETGHLIVAAIRVLTHQKGVPPSPEAVGKSLGYSTEKVLHICRRLEEEKVIKPVNTPYGQRLYIKDHLKLENLPKTPLTQSMKEDISRYEEEKEAKHEDLKKRQMLHKEQKKSLFADIEKQLREGPKKKKNPLDDI